MNEQIPLRFRLLQLVARLLQAIGRVGRAIVWPFEWVFMTVLYAAFALSERIGNLESILGSSWQFLRWHVGRSWHALFATPKLPGAMLRAMAAGVHGVGWCWGWCCEIVLRTAERLNLDRLFWGLVSLSKPLWYPIVALGTFVAAWVGTRPYRHLLWGLPALLLIVPLCGVVAWGALFGRDNIASHYSLALSQAIDDRDHNRVQLFERKLAALQLEVPRTKFNHALTLEREGKLPEAYARMVISTERSARAISRFGDPILAT